MRSHFYLGLFHSAVYSLSLSALSFLHPSLPSLPTESWHFFSAPIPSLLNSSHPSLLKFSFHFVIALALIFLPTHSLHFLLYSTPLSTHSLSLVLNYNLSFFPKASNACSIHPKRQAGRQAGRQALLALWNGPARPQAQLCSEEEEYNFHTLLHSREVSFLFSVLGSELWNESIHNTQHRP